MRRLLPFALVLFSKLPLFAASRPDTTIYIYKEPPLSHVPAIRLDWQLLDNGSIAQKGVIPYLPLSPKPRTAVHIPARITPGNDEIFLRLVYRRPSYRSTPILTQLLPIRTWKGDYAIPPAGDISFSDSNDIFTVNSANAVFQFDKQSGWLLHYEANHLVLVYDSNGLRPSIWPPGATQPRLQLFSTSTGSQLVMVRAEYTLPEVSCLLHMSYTINAAGDMLVGQSLEADSSGKGPVLPRFGMTWTLPAGLDSATCYAPPSDTTSPEIFHTTLSTAPPTYVRWIAITNPDIKTIRIVADSAFLLLHSDGKQLNIDRPASSYPYGSYQYSFKFSPALLTHSVSSRTDLPATSHPQPHRPH